MPVIIYIDGTKYQVNDTGNLLHVCLSLGLDIPYFCWHPALGSVGACRQCAVKQYQDEKDDHGRLVMSCMTPVNNGMWISINDDDAKEFRKSVSEWLMINHPHDCPVCEEGGHCHLQDMTVMNGHILRRYRFTKRTHLNQYLGPFISHEMNRCITCYRCIRFYKNYSDGTDLGVYGVSDNVYFGRTEDGILENEFSGNLVEVCPTGVFTDKTHSAHYNRKWDMQFAPSICQQCSLGCNISLGERYGELRRVENRYNGMVNRYFLCDRGRFGYGYLNLKNRPRQPMQRHGTNWTLLNTNEALDILSNNLRQAKKIIGIGSPRASIESNFSLLSIVGAANFSTGMTLSEQACINLIIKILQNSGIYTPSLFEIENYDAILVLGEDITQTGARMALAVRQAIKGKARVMAERQKVATWDSSAILNMSLNSKYPLFVTNVDKTRLDDVATWSYYAPIEDQARLGFAIAHQLDASAPKVSGLDKDLIHQIAIIAKALDSAKKPLIISGSNSGNEAIIQAAANIAKSLMGNKKEVGISFLTSEVNSIGVGLIGGFSLDKALDALASGEADSVIILENNLYRHISRDLIDLSLRHTKNIIVLDHQNTQTTKKANLVLSSASFAESHGTVVSQEGRAQRFFQVYDPSFYDNTAQVFSSWCWLNMIKKAMYGRKVDCNLLDDVINACIKEVPQLAGIKKASPDSSFRMHGQKLARSPHRFSGRTAMLANISVHEPQQPQDKDSMFSFSMEGSNPLPDNHVQIPFSWAPGWNSSQSLNKFKNIVDKQLFDDSLGVRLISSDKATLSWFTDIPSAFIRQNHCWRITPYFHIFGSEELSQRSKVIRERMPKPYIIMNAQDSIQLKIQEGATLFFSCQGEDFVLPVYFSNNLQSGQIGLPLGFPGFGLFLCGEGVYNFQTVTKP
ncbi:NADH-quinone oxidoreductase subunit NuoG [Candidatus Erwinia haradaeae]|uniref:NADH-quinone oxidoreductase n=1 Tax=Candidatus Erwinia haradaeae TaxID=1922217 RepID=A0A451DJX0_9GAMM|nr:NADH-quinone oxidoreductase subunit NuoG [Candidatus Erwinia haradaeae]VFP87028.1 NADH-quinone oxidoreductase subunit G [Candidatus Erwinia haradaeae]